MAILVAPTEPAQLRAIATKVTLMPESWGVDVLIHVNGVKVGVQRKEVGDLIGSLGDGRLAMQLSQMQCANADWNVLLLEGETKYTNDGALIGQWSGGARGRGGRDVFMDSHLTGVLWSLAAVEGVTVMRTGSLAETVRWVQATEKWWAKDGHKGLRVRPAQGGGAWGRGVSRVWGAWVLQGWPGIGAGLAERIVDKFGRAPIGWTCSAKELAEVKGISLERARKWVEG